MKSKFNVIDIVIIVIVILAVLTCGFLFYKNKTDSSALTDNEKSKISFVIEANNITENLANMHKKGDYIKYGKKGDGEGIITNVEVIPHRVWAKNNEDGEFIISEVPDRYTAKITIEADVFENENFYSCNGEKIMIGKNMPFATKNISFDCYVVDLILE